MTDEELLRKLAEIEGRATHFLDDNMESRDLSADPSKWWDPLLHWSDCGPLVEKYKLWICAPDKTRTKFSERELWSARGPLATDTEVYKSADLKRAICLAIIASKEYPTDCRICGKSWESVTRSGKTIIRSLDMDDLDRRRLNRLNAEYKQSPDYIEPVFSSRLKFAISVFVLTIFALVTMIIIDG